jgi:hypothetical protein
MKNVKKCPVRLVYRTGLAQGVVAYDGAQEAPPKRYHRVGAEQPLI